MWSLSHRLQARCELHSCDIFNLIFSASLLRFKILGQIDLQVHKAVDACKNVLRGLHSNKITERELDRVSYLNARLVVHYNLVEALLESSFSAKCMHYQCSNLSSFIPFFVSYELILEHCILFLRDGFLKKSKYPSG